MLCSDKAIASILTAPKLIDVGMAHNQIKQVRF
jgi:hypothetical protein